MSTALRLTPDEYDRMIAKGAFDGINRRIELIHGELREMNPAGPVHEDYIDFLNRWSTESTTSSDCVVRVQSSIDLADSRPEPDVTWLRPGRYASQRPQASDVMLLIEVADSSMATDMNEKAILYAQSKVAEYWVVDIPSRCIHVFADSDQEVYRTARRVDLGEELSPRCQPSATLNLSDLFADG